MSRSSTTSNGSVGDYIVTNRIGSGSFAVVYKGYHKTTKVPVAIKALSLQKLNKKLLANLESEISIMQKIHHPNIVKLYDIKKTEKHIYLMLEYCAGGDLQQFMKQFLVTDASDNKSESVKVLSERSAQHFLSELAKGMHCLWQHNWIHRDLKPQNLLLSEFSLNARLKIADFGFARHLATTSMAETLCGSPLYMAPEILKFQKYDAKADLWSIGTILYELLIGKPPFGGANHVQLLANIERKELQFPDSIKLSSDCLELLKMLLRRNPLYRAGFDEFFRHPFVKFSTAASMTGSAEIEVQAENLTKFASNPCDAFNYGSSTSAIDELATPGTDSKGHETEDSLKQTILSTLKHCRSDNVEIQQSGMNAHADSTESSRTNATTLQALRPHVHSARRAYSSNTILIKNVRNSPDSNLTPSPRINPFKTSITSSSSSNDYLIRRTKVFSDNFVTNKIEDKFSGPIQKNENHISDSSGEYVLVEKDTKAQVMQKEAADQAIGTCRESTTPTACDPHRICPSSCCHPSRAAISYPPFSDKSAQQFVDNIILRARAMTPVADVLWQRFQMCSIQSSYTEDHMNADLIKSTQNCLSMFSMSMEASVSSSQSGDDPAKDPAITAHVDCRPAVTAGVRDLGSSGSGPSRCEDIVFGIETFAVYLKCLRLLQAAILYMQQDPMLSQTYKPSTSSGSSVFHSPISTWSLPSRKVTLTYLVEQLSICLERADICKKFLTSRMEETVTSCLTTALSAEQIVYANAIERGKEGAIKEILGQQDAAYELYMQAMLLFEIVLMNSHHEPKVSQSAGRSFEQVNEILKLVKQVKSRMKKIRRGEQDNTYSKT